MIVMVQCFAPDCNHRSESDTYRSLVSLAGKKADEHKVDSSIEVSKDFVVIYGTFARSIIEWRWPCCLPRMYSSRSSQCFHLFCLVITGSPTLTLKVSFFLVNNEEKKQ